MELVSIFLSLSIHPSALLPTCIIAEMRKGQREDKRKGGKPKTCSICNKCVSLLQNGCQMEATLQVNHRLLAAESCYLLRRSWR